MSEETGTPPWVEFTMAQYRSLVGARLKTLQRESGYIQSELGEPLNLNRKSIASWMRGDRSFSIAELVGVAARLVVSPAYLGAASEKEALNANKEPFEITPDELLTHAGISCRIARSRSNVTINELADRVGINRSYLSTFENGHRPISVPLMAVLAINLGVPLIEWLDPRLQITYDQGDLNPYRWRRRR